VKHLTGLSLFILALIPLSATAQAATPTMVREIYTCNFNDGKGMSDLMAARDFYLKQMEKAGIKPSQAFVWTPYKAAVNFDFLWANNFPDMMTWAREADRYDKSAEGQAADARFATVATCQASLANRRQFFQAEGELNVDQNRGAILNAGACSYRRGHGPDDLDDLLNHVAAVMGSTGLKDGFIAYASVPSMGTGDATRDFYLYGVQSDLESFAARSAAMNAAPGMDSLRRHFQTIARCDTAMFLGRQVVEAP